MAAALMSVVLGGCVTEGPSINEFVVKTIHGFTATRGEHLVEFGGPVTIQDREGQPFRAYEVVVRTPDRSFEVIYYLDAAFREVGHINGCGWVVDSCETLRLWQWEGEGRVNWLGIGIPALITANDLADLSGGQRRALPWEIKSLSSSKMTLQVTMTTTEDAPYESTYTYMPGRLLPDGGAAASNYTDLGRLESADLLSLPRAWPSPARWNHLMFPGEEEDTFALGATHADVVRTAEGNLTVGGEPCVGAYYLSIRRPSAGLLPDRQQQVGSASVDLHYADRIKEVDINVWRDELLQETTIEVEETSERPLTRSCAEIYRAPGAQMPIETGLSFATGVLGFHNVSRFIHFWGSQQFQVGQPPEAGWHHYEFHFDVDQNGLWNEPIRVGFETAGPTRYLNAQVDPRNDPFILDEA